MEYYFFPKIVWIIQHAGPNNLELQIIAELLSTYKMHVFRTHLFFFYFFEISGNPNMADSN